MSEGSNSSNSGKTPWFGVRPIFLIAGAVALLGFGIISGVAFDLATRPVSLKTAPPVPRVEAKPSRQADRPHIEIPEAIAQQSESILQAPPPSPVVPEKPAEKPLALNAVPAPPAGPAVVAIVIDDMGLDRTRSNKMMTLPGPLTLSLMTYADGLGGLVEQARKSGHEIMAHLPMEPVDPKENPGKGALLANMDDATIRRTLAADLDGWKGYVGVNNHMGSKFTKDRARMAVVMEELKARGLLWLDSKTIGDTAGPAAAKAAGVPYLERDIFLDNVETVDAINGQLDNLVAAAKAKGAAIAIGHPHDSTYAALREWLPTLAAQGVTLVPVTEILKRRER